MIESVEGIQAKVKIQEKVLRMMAHSVPAGMLRGSYLVEVCINSVQLLALGLQLPQRIGCQLTRPLGRLQLEALLGLCAANAEKKVTYACRALTNAEDFT